VTENLLADPFKAIAAINAWLDWRNTHLTGKEDDAMRVLKLGEEIGEASRAYIGMTGQNPRKGYTHTERQFLDELADVAVTALCAIQHFTQDEDRTRVLFAIKIQRIIERIDTDDRPLDPRV
jgi:hypothetical protein